MSNHDRLHLKPAMRLALKVALPEREALPFGVCALIALQWQRQWVVASRAIPDRRRTRHPQCPSLLPAAAWTRMRRATTQTGAEATAHPQASGSKASEEWREAASTIACAEQGEDERGQQKGESSSLQQDQKTRSIGAEPELQSNHFHIGTFTNRTPNRIPQRRETSVTVHHGRLRGRVVKPNGTWKLDRAARLPRA